MSRAVVVGLVAAACGHPGGHPSDSGPGDVPIDVTDSPPDASADAACQPPSGNPTPVSVTFTAGAYNPSFVAYRDGCGPWLVAPAPAGTTYTFPVASGAYGVAWEWATTPGGNLTAAVVTAYFTVAERTTLNVFSTTLPATVQLSGVVSNMPTTGQLLVAPMRDATFGHVALRPFGYGFGYSAVNATTGAYSIPAPPGLRDLVVLHTASTGNDVIADAAAVVRGIDVTGATTVDVDFATSQPTSSSAVTVNGLTAGDRVLTGTNLFASGTYATTVCCNTSLVSEALASSQAAATDVYDQAVSVYHALYSAPYATMEIANHAPGALILDAPPALGPIATDVPTSSPYPRIRSAWPAYPDAVGYLWSANQQPFNEQLVWAAWISAGAAGAMPSFEMPDFSALAGWNSVADLHPNVGVSGDLTVMTSSAGPGDFPVDDGEGGFQVGAPASAGTTRMYVHAAWTATP